MFTARLWNGTEAGTKDRNGTKLITPENGIRSFRKNTQTTFSFANAVFEEIFWRITDTKKNIFVCTIFPGGTERN